MCIKYKYLHYYYYWHALNTPTYEYKLFIKYNNIFKFHINILHKIITVLYITNLLVYKLYFIIFFFAYKENNLGYKPHTNCALQ